jgi:acetyl-CoA carboxylase beta subunit
MNWVSFITGGMTVLIAYALFTSHDDEKVDVNAEPDEGETNLVVNDFSGRHVTLSCQTCRKLKKHKEVQPGLFQCTKCKRHVDLRAS